MNISLYKKNNLRRTRYNLAHGGDHLKHAGPGYIGGYPGLATTALQISELIPHTKIYVEPFAGLGRTVRFSNADKIILNDMSKYAREFLTKNFKNAEIFGEDWSKMLRFDSADTFFLFDPPWSETEYKDGCEGHAFCDRTAKQYYIDIFKILPTLKGHWFLCGNVKNKTMEKSTYFNKVVESRRKLMGGYIKTQLISNKEFKRYSQTEFIHNDKPKIKTKLHKTNIQKHTQSQLF